MAQREFDFVLYGATGYTGRLTLDYLARTKRDVKTFALAGRNLAKLKEVAQAAGLPVDTTNFIVADASSAESLRAMAARARAVVAMVGPFALYGMPLVLACITARTHYVDITGEFNFVADVAQLNDQAREAGIYLVCCAGFDCVPFDLVNYQVNRRAATLAVSGGATVKCIQTLDRVVGGLSGGTMATLANMIGGHIRKSDREPLSLLTAAQQTALGPQAVTPYCGFPRISFPAFCKPAGTYVGPFLLAGMNMKIARKTSAMLGFRATYVEGAFGTFLQVLRDFLQATILPLMLMMPVLKSLISRLLPAGEGPSAAVRVKCKSTIVARGFDADPMKDANAKELVRVTMHLPMDSYTFTAISAIETAQAIVDGELTAEAKETGRFWSGGGAVTPAAVVGDSLARRLEKAGVKFD